MECNFTVGQKVVCVDHMNNSQTFKLPEIKKGRTYKIRELGIQVVDGVGIFDDEVTVWLEGISRPYKTDCGVNDIGFRCSRFRPVVERKTDISCFTAMLNPSKEQVPA